jgi:ABC-type multidrug transport system fused ATPase/permease subunit
MTLLFKLLRKRTLLVTAAVVINILSAAAALFWNFKLSEIINAVSSGGRLDGRTAAVMIMLIFVNALFACGLGLISGFSCETLAHDLRMGYARNLKNMPITDIENLNAGEQLSRLQNEISNVSEYMQSNLFQITDSFIRFISTFSWLLFINPSLALSANLPVALIIIYIVYSSKIISFTAEQSQQAKMKMNGYADTLLTLFPVIRLYDAAGLLIERYGAELKTWERLVVREERTKAGLMSLSALLSCIPLLLLLLVGGTMVINNLTTLGTLYIFINLSGNVSGVMMNMPGFIAAFRRFSANMKRLEPCVLLAERKR